MTESVSTAEKNSSRKRKAQSTAPTDVQTLQTKPERRHKNNSSNKTLANVFASDYGNFSDGLRKAFHHEPISYTRRKDREFVELLRPRLSTILSGTPEQVKSLIPNAENGLLSRFIFYTLSATDEWLDGFSGYDADNPLEKVFDELGKEIDRFYQHLKQYQEIWFTLSIVQQQKFNDYFAEEKQRMKELNGDLYNASTHRLSCALLRIAMILSALRCMDTGKVPETIECADTDFDTALSIIKTISQYNDYIFNVLNEGVTEEVKVSETYSSAARATRSELLHSYSEHFHIGAQLSFLKELDKDKAKAIRSLNKRSFCVTEIMRPHCMKILEQEKLHERHTSI